MKARGTMYDVHLLQDVIHVEIRVMVILGSGRQAVAREKRRDAGALDTAQSRLKRYTFQGRLTDPRS